ncbi:MAG TPA: hypothetical protein VGS80_03380, partial [Ktedonobacterales bacterium]|nr:hypothetical protein [Ktedonobacterales bacterium]
REKPGQPIVEKGPTMPTQTAIVQPIVIPMEDDPIHTLETSFCSDPTCPCKEDQVLLGEVARHIESGLLTPAEAARLVAGQQV